MSREANTQVLAGLGITPPETFDYNLALNLGWKAYTRFFGQGALFILIFFLLTVISVLTIAGLIAALPHLVAGLTMAGYYMTRGTVKTDDLFCGFKAYGSVLAASLLLWIMHFVISLIFVLPYYISLFSELGVSSGSYSNILESLAKGGGSLGSQSSIWSLLSFLQYPFTFYLQARFLLVFPLIIDHRTDAISALKISWYTTEKLQWPLVLYVFLAAILGFVAVFAGVLLCFVGIFITAPFSMTMMGAAIHQMMGEKVPDWAIQPPPYQPPSSGSNIPPGV